VELKRIQQEVGITFIYVTHDQEEAMTMSDRIAVMNHGRYEQLDNPEILYERPATRFVAGFLGISNLLPATVVGNDGAYASARLVDDTTIRIPAGLVNGHADIRIGIRPEKIRLSEATSEGPSGHNRLPGVVRDASYIGVSTQYLVESRGGTLMVYEQNVERATRAELWARGDQVQMTWSPDHSFVVPTDDAGADDDAPALATTTAGEGEPAEPPTPA
jgi:spermidine/putrescine transport system ATP-binding protein